MEILCMLAKSTADYGFSLEEGQILRVANLDETDFLLQAELRAQHFGLIYKEIDYNSGYSYKGYVNSEN